MNTAKLAAALNTISVAFGELAEALIESEAGEREVRLGANPTATTPPPAAPAGAASPPAPPELSPFEDETSTWDPPDTLLARLDEGSEANCPKHRVAFTAGQYGPYCQQTTDDPAWGKQKGDRLWCKITPKNAAEYLRIKAAA